MRLVLGSGDNFNQKPRRKSTHREAPQVVGFAVKYDRLVNELY